MCGLLEMKSANGTIIISLGVRQWTVFFSSDSVL